MRPALSLLLLLACDPSPGSINVDAHADTDGGFDLAEPDDLQGRPDLQSPFDGSITCPACPASKPACGGDGQCRKCVAHAECPSGICILEPDVDSTRLGTCVPDVEIARIDNHGETLNDCQVDHPMRDGKSAATAYCDIEEAVLVTTGSYHLVTGHGTAFPYAKIALASGAQRRIVIVGTPGTVVTDAAQPPLLIAQGGADSLLLFVDGLDLAGNASSAVVSVQGSSAASTYLTVRRSTLHGGKLGVDINDAFAQVTLSGSVIRDCSGAALHSQTGVTFLYLDGNQIFRNGAGLELDHTSYSLGNNVISFNSGAALTFDAASSPRPPFGFSYNTLAGNGGGVQCGATQRFLEASIVVRNGAVGGTQFQGSCALVDVVTGTDSAAGAITSAPVFVHEAADAPDLHLLGADPANAACCIDRATSGIPDGGAAELPDHDVDGQLRPLGAGRDVGADEVK